MLLELLRDPQIPLRPPKPPWGPSKAPGEPPNPSGPPKSPQNPHSRDPPKLPWGPPKPPKTPQMIFPELFLTEHAHVRMLRVLLELFYQPMLREGFFDEQELSNIFPSLEDLVEVHSEVEMGGLRMEMGGLRVEIGGSQFEGTEGSWFQKISARFCSRQSFALEQLKAKQRKDTRFNQFIQEAESRPRCRRLQLKDIIPTEMQRLTKYPLLLLSITKCTEAAAERAKVEQAAECCRQILNHVNQEVRDMENLMVGP
uniref:DH domain-containing protein n=1 Tax=Zosterops lateralis melanops TaxID=1220523 RepID=A0A8D2NSF1_ZOSLA